MKITFVCRDNLTRSLTAEFCLRDYLQKNKINDVEVDSVALEIKDYEKIYDYHLQIMKKLGIDSFFKPRKKADAEHLKRFGVVIAMDTYIQERLFDEFGVNSLLFNEVYCGKKTSVKIDWQKDEEGIKKELENFVYYLKESMPSFLENLRNRIK